MRSHTAEPSAPARGPGSYRSLGRPWRATADRVAVAMASSTRPRDAGPDVRGELVRLYEALASQYSDSRHRSWRDRSDAAASGEILVEPGWMLRQIVGDEVDIHGIYRVYVDGRVERDRILERADRDRFLRAGRSERGEDPLSRSRSDRSASADRPLP